MATPQLFHAAYGKLSDSRDALKTARDAMVVEGSDANGTKDDKYELGLMSDETLDIQDRLILMMQRLNVPLTPPSA